MKKEESIKRLLPNYFEGRSEEKKQQFLSKSIDKQYASIMAWKRRHNLKTYMDGVSAGDIIKHVKSVKDLIPMATNLTERELGRLAAELAEAQEKVANYAAIRRQREIEELERAQQELQARLDQLRNQQ